MTPSNLRAISARARFRAVATIALVGAIASAAGGCNTLTRLSDVGAEPKMSAVSNPVAQPGYRPVSLPKSALFPTFG